jgi:hypothetical protein
MVGQVDVVELEATPVTFLCELGYSGTFSNPLKSRYRLNTPEQLNLSMVNIEGLWSQVHGSLFRDSTVYGRNAEISKGPNVSYFFRAQKSSRMSV